MAIIGMPALEGADFTARGLRICAMRVVTMRVVVSPMGVVLVVMAVMPMAAVGVAVMLMAVPMGVAAMTIGAAFWIERLVDQFDAAVEPAHHTFKNMVVLQPQPAFTDLYRHMAIAQMVGDPHESGGRWCTDMDERFDRCAHPNVFTGCAGDDVPISQNGAAWQVDTNGLPGEFARIDGQAQSRFLSPFKGQSDLAFECFVRFTQGIENQHDVSSVQ